MKVDTSILDFDHIDIFVIDNVKCIMATDNPDFMNSMRNFFTDKVPNSQFMPQVKSGIWDGNIQHISNNGSFARGLLGEVKDKMDEWEIPYRIHEDEEEITVNVDNFDRVIEEELVSKQDTPMSPWNHQVDIAKILIKNKRGIARSATSSGKTYTMAMICKYLHYMKFVSKTLIIVPKTDLVVQFQRDAIGFGYKMDEVGIFFGDVKDTEQPIIVSTWQSAMNQDEKYFHQFDMVIADECFVGETLVNTESGYKEIKNLKCGEKVYSYNEHTGVVELKPITRIYENRTKSSKLIKIKIDNGKVIKCTPNHLFKTENRGWVQAKDLKTEDLLVEGNCDFV